MSMVPAGQSSGMPEEMSRACARFFAADWEALSFLEFFVDLQLRVADDPTGSVGRTLARLGDHARFALQITLVRSVDSFVAYLAEITEYVAHTRHTSTLSQLLKAQGKAQGGSQGSDKGERERLDCIGTWDQRIPVDLTAKYAVTLVHGNVRQLARQFEEATETTLFQTEDELERFSRLSSLRNLIAQGRTFASDDLSVIVAETTSVGGLGLRLSSFREDLECLRVVVVRIDRSAAERWNIARPITSARLFEAIGAAASASRSRSDQSADRATLSDPAVSTAPDSD
jgi:hypothetical protein